MIGTYTCKITMLAKWHREKVMIGTHTFKIIMLAKWHRQKVITGRILEIIHYINK